MLVEFWSCFLASSARLHIQEASIAPSSVLATSGLLDEYSIIKSRDQ